MAKCKALTGSAVKGLMATWRQYTTSSLNVGQTGSGRVNHRHHSLQSGTAYSGYQTWRLRISRYTCTFRTRR